MMELFKKSGSVPALLQSERSECGLACLAMIAAYYGKAIDLNTLRRNYPVSAHGATLAEILGIADQLQLSARPLRLELEDLGELQLPAILHWDMTHFVVLTRVSQKSITIHDPAVGKRKYSINEAGRHVTGIAVELTPMVGFQPEKKRQSTRLGDLYSTYPGFWGFVAQLLLMSVCLQLVSIGSAFFMQTVIDESIARQDLNILDVLALGFLLLALAGVVMTFIRARLQLYFSNQLGFQMVGNVFVHMMSLPADFFERRHTGDLVSRFGSIREIRRIVSEDMVTVVMDGAFAVLTLVVMFIFSPALAAVASGFVLVVALIKLMILPHTRNLQEQMIIAEAKTSTSLMENMRAISIIKFYCRELQRVLGWRKLYAEQINTQVNFARFAINFELVFGCLFAVENILVIYLAASQVLSGTITLGYMTAFMALRTNFSTAIRSFIEKLVQIRLVRLQLDRVSDITGTQKEFNSLNMPAITLPLKGGLTLENISYGYPGSSHQLITGVSLQIPAGSSLAIVGPSGAGKSTLLKLMAGLLEPDTGVIHVDGTDIRKVGIRQYRNICAGILQSDQLLSGSLLENITLFELDVDIQKVYYACQRACIHDLIMTLPMKYHSLVGDMGSNLSAGQAQRILLARAFYKEAKILFLDEATANLDLQTETEILQTIRNLGSTLIIISHRPDIVALADRRFVLSRDSVYV